MKGLCKASVFLAACLLAAACGQTVANTPTQVPFPAAAVTAIPSQAMFTATPLPSPTATATFAPTPTQGYVPPTLIPTIDPTLVPGLLKNAFSVQTLEGVHGHTIQQITGWEYGFGNTMYPYYCLGHSWLDPSHLLLYPVIGQKPGSDGWGRYNLVPQPVVINLETGAAWLPPVQTENYGTCHKVYSSRELGILVNHETKDDSSIVSTYTYDGRKLASYPGGLADISPSGTKILIGENTLIDLRTNKMIKLDWSLEDYNEPHLSYLYWTYPDETRVYRCCYFYADITSGISERFQRSDFQDTDGNHLDPIGLWFHQGEWVRDNTYFLVSWLAVDDGPVRYLPMFDPATKLFYDVMEMAGLPGDWEAVQTTASPDGNYVLLKGWEDSYLVNLVTFEAQHYAYPDLSYDMDIWAPDSEFMWFQSHDSDNKSTEVQVLSISDRKLSHLPITPLPDSDHWWHPTKATVVYPAADANTLIFLDPSTMSYRELSFNLHKLPAAYGNVVYGKVVWSPNGEKLALVAEDGSVWQVDYPKLENLEQLTEPMPDVRDVFWSPDGSSIAFIGGSDIYIVDTMK